jgi:polyhydroxybutyrate depolymerase
MDGALMRKFTGYEFDNLADTRGFAVFYPDGYQSNWNDCLKAGAVAATLEHVDDVGFILALIGKAQSEFKIDPKKVYLVGYSNGGQLAMTLANLSPGPAAGIAVFGADLPTPDNSTCLQDSRTPPIMIVAGTDDPISPYNGGKVSIFGFQNKGTVVSAPATAEAFARRNGIGTPPSEEMLPHRDPSDPTSVQRLTWRKDGEPYVVFYSVRGGGHTVPQPIFRYPRILGRTTEDLDGPAQAIAFFYLRPSASAASLR